MLTICHKWAAGSGSPQWNAFELLMTNWGPLLGSPETFRAYFGWHNFLCMFKTKASRGTKLCGYFNFYSLYNIWIDQLYRTSGLEFYEWLLGSEKFSGISRNGPLVIIPEQGQFGQKQLPVRQNWRDPFAADWLICPGGGTPIQKGEGCSSSRLGV